MFSSGPRGGGGMRGYNSFTGGMDDDEDELGPFGGGGGFRYRTFYEACRTGRRHRLLLECMLQPGCRWHAAIMWPKRKPHITCAVAAHRAQTGVM